MGRYFVAVKGRFDEQDDDPNRQPSDDARTERSEVENEQSRYSSERDGVSPSFRDVRTGGG